LGGGQTGQLPKTLEKFDYTHSNGGGASKTKTTKTDGKEAALCQKQTSLILKQVDTTSSNQVLHLSIFHWLNIPWRRECRINLTFSYHTSQSKVNLDGASSRIPVKDESTKRKKRNFQGADDQPFLKRSNRTENTNSDVDVHRQQHEASLVFPSTL